MTSSNLPPWALEHDTNDRIQGKLHAKAALAALGRYFGRLARPRTESEEEWPASDQGGRSIEDALESLGDTFDERTSEAISSLAKRLHFLLYEQVDEFIEGQSSQSAYMVSYLGDSRLQELGTFIERIFTIGDGTAPLGKQAVTDFLLAWTTSAGGELSAEGNAGGSTSRRTVFFRWGSQLTDAANQFQQALAVGDILESQELARQAAGEKGAAVIGGDFKAIAQEESFTAMAWTGLSFGALVAVLCIGIYAINHPTSGDWKLNLFHLALTLPVIGIAAFAARLARHHRLLARWAKTAAVQVNSIGAFARQMPTDEGREALILHLGRTVFGPPVFVDESKTENVSGVPPGLIELLKEVVKRDTLK